MKKNSGLYSVAESYHVMYDVFTTMKFTLRERKKVILAHILSSGSC